MSSFFNSKPPDPHEEHLELHWNLKQVGRFELDFSIKRSPYLWIVIIKLSSFILEIYLFKEPNFERLYQDFLKVWTFKFNAKQFFHKTFWINDIW